jgi:hypothetical protein
VGVFCKTKGIFNAPRTKSAEDKESAEHPGEITSDFTGQAQRKTKI